MKKCIQNFYINLKFLNTNTIKIKINKNKHLIKIKTQSTKTPKKNPNSKKGTHRPTPPTRATLWEPPESRPSESVIGASVCTEPRARAHPHRVRRLLTLSTVCEPRVFRFRFSVRVQPIVFVLSESSVVPGGGSVSGFSPRTSWRLLQLRTQVINNYQYFYC